MNLVFLGPPGAGKGTQAERICEKQKIAHISTGDMLRSEMRQGTELGLAAKSLIEKGELVPDEIIIGMVRNRILQDDCKNGYLLDGFPRTIEQAEALAEFADIDCAVDVEVPFERLVQRISGRRMCPDCGATFHISMYTGDTCDKCNGKLYQRDDDKEETVMNRLKVYEKSTQPLIDFYKERGLLKTVNGDQDIEVVYGEIESALQ